VGGGGLIAGKAVYVKLVRPDIKIVGVEPDDTDCLNRALKANGRVIIEQVGLFADGVAVKQGRVLCRVYHDTEPFLIDGSKMAAGNYNR
ncbi:MAG: pyridoxal-phosphate dependent enzyme, partial [Methylobacter sp.]